MTTDIAPVVALAERGRFDEHMTAVTHPDAPLDAFLAYFRMLATTDVADLCDPPSDNPLIQFARAFGRMQGSLESLTTTITRSFDPAVRSAPPSGLAEVVREVARPCVNPSCEESWLPWESSACSPECEAIAETCI
jgi:hypothetical protein